MFRNAKARPALFILLFYFICFVFRAIEYLVIRTDQSVIGEAFIHKLIGIALLATAVWGLKYRWADIGFRANQALRGILLGLLLGIGVFAVAYGVEMLIQSSAGNGPALRFFVTSYAVQGNNALQDGLLFVLICIAGNLINVVMEEGVFRGLFLRLMEEKYSFLKACLYPSVLFGIWHIAQPVRNVMDGEQSAFGALMSGLLLVVTSALLAVQYCMLLKVTGSIWAGMAAHFVNNAVINLLHIATSGGLDELQTVRIAIAQSLSFVIVLVFFIIHIRRKKRSELAAVA